MQQGTIYRLNCHVWWKVAFLQQPVMTSWVARLRRSSKAFPKVKLAPKKSHGHCLVVCCPSDPLQLYEIQQNHYVWEMCSAYQWDAPKTTMPEASIGQQKEPDSSPQQFLTHVSLLMLQKLKELGYKVLPHPPYPPDISPNDYHFFKHLDNFMQEKCFHNQQEGENVFQEFIES